METKKFSLDDVVVLKSEDLLDETGLSMIIGGIAAKAADCSCKCTWGNCYEET